MRDIIVFVCYDVIGKKQIAFNYKGDVLLKYFYSHTVLMKGEKFMKNKSYKIPFGVLTAVFGFSYLMYALTFFNFFVQDFFDFMPALDPLQWLYDYTGTFLWCFMCVLIVAVITAVFYHKYLANKTRMLIYLGAVAAGTLLPLALLGLFVV